MRWANRRMLQCSLRRSLDAATASSHRSTAPPSGSIDIAPLPERSKSLFFARPIAIGCLALIIIASLVWAVWRLPSRHTDIIERKLTSNSSENSVNSAAVSPDGKYLAYSDNTGIYLKLVRIGQVHPVPLPPDFAARVDDWFPDGSRLTIWRRDKPGKASLWSISVFGGTPHPLAVDAFGGSVSPDGAHIVFGRVDVPYDILLGREQWVMRSDGTHQIKVAADKSDGSALGAPTWSPNGKRIAYFRTKWFDPQTSSVEVNDWQNATAETLFSDSRLTPALHWLPDGLLIYGLGTYGFENAKDSSLWMVSLQKSGKISGFPKTRRTRARIDSAHCCERGRKSIKLPERALVAEHLHRRAGAGRRTLACEQATDAR